MAHCTLALRCRISWSAPSAVARGCLASRPASTSWDWRDQERPRRWPRFAPGYAWPGSCRSAARFARAILAGLIDYWRAARRLTLTRIRIRMANRWWTYLSERFPVFGHGPLIA